MDIPAPGSILRHPSFVLFWFARIAVTAGYQMLIVAVAWQLYALTNDPFDLGLIGLIQFIPAMLLFLVVGQITDRYDRRLLLILCQSIESVAAGTLLVALVTGGMSRELILCVAFILGVARAFEVTLMQIMVPNLVPVALVPRATAASASANQAAAIVGPALGGFRYATGPAIVYGTCLALFAGAILLTFLIHVERVAPAREPLSLKTFFAGLSYIRHQRVILGVISLDLFAVLLGGVTALLPVFARDIYAAGPWALGLLRAAPGVGALSMALVLTRWELGRGTGKVIFAAVAAFGLSTIVFALSHSLIVALIALVVLARRGARPRDRGQRPLHRRVEPARRISRRHDGVMDRRGAGGPRRRDRDAVDRRALDTALSRACAPRSARTADLITRRRRAGAMRRPQASDPGNPTATRGRRGRRPAGPRNAPRASWPRAAPCAPRRAWSSGTSSRG